MKTPGDRLRAMRERRGFKTARDAARAYGWDINTYASHENGNRGIPPDAAVTYSKRYQFSLDWLYKGTNTIASSGVIPIPKLASKIVPRLLWNFLEKHGSVETAMERATEFTSLPKTLEIEMPAFSMTVSGDSMKGTGQGLSFEDGDECIFSTRAAIKPGNFVLAELLDENTVVFRQYRERGRGDGGFMVFELAPLNSAYPTRLVTKPEQARIVAKMTHCIKSYT